MRSKNYALFAAVLSVTLTLLALQIQAKPADGAAGNAPRTTSPAPVTVQYECRVQYTVAGRPAGEVSFRSLTLTHQGSKLTAVEIDGQNVYRFSAQDTVLFTSMDSERIQIEFVSKSSGKTGSKTGVQAGSQKSANSGGKNVSPPTVTWNSNHRDRDFASGVCLPRGG